MAQTTVRRNWNGGFFPSPKASSVAESQAGLPNGISRAALLPHPVHLETKL